MATRVYRGASLDGINTSLRDAGVVPYTLTRSMRNFSLTDKRMIRRPSFKRYSTTKYIGSQLCQPVSAKKEAISGRDSATQTTVTSWVKCPFSYGLLRYHTDIQPKIASDWSTEFLLTLGRKESFITNGYYRQSLSSPRYNVRGGYDGSAAVPQKGAYVFDYTVIANECTFSDDNGGTSVALPLGTTGASNDFDTVALPGLAISYYSDGSDNVVVEASFALVNTATDEYLRYIVKRTTSFTYTEGDTYHILVKWDASTGIFSLHVSDSGSKLDSGISLTVTTASRKWAGESDPVNTYTNTHSVNRDLVILNECTVRGHYASTCAFRGNGNKSSGSIAAGAQNVLMASSDSSIQQPNSWCISPTAGTCMSELRFWNTLRTDSSYVDDSFTNIVVFPSSLLVYLKLDEGSGYCRDLISNGGVAKNLTVHSTIPQWIADSGLLHDTGLSIADNQFIINSLDSFDYLYSKDVAVKLRDTLVIRRGDISSTDKEPRSDFTVQIQIRTPHSFQQNISKHNQNTTSGGQTTGKDSGLRWWDGSYVNSGGVFRVPLQKDDGLAEDEDRWDGYYATLFSIEGVQNSVDSVGNIKPEGSYSKTRIPLIQGLLTPEGKVHFRVFQKRGSTASDAAGIYYVTSNTVLSPDTVYTITFRKVTELRSASTSVGTYLDIFIDDVKDSNVRNLITPGEDSSFIEHNLLSVRADSAGISRKNIRSSKYDVIIGASKINDVIDENIGYAHDWTKQPDVLDRSSSHFMGNFSDQPGFFTLGFFRMWGVGLSSERISSTYNRSVDGKDSSLIYNIELNQQAGSDVRSSSRYDATFELGFKSFGDSFPDVTEQSGGGGGSVSTSIPEVVSSHGSTASLVYNRLPTNYKHRTESGLVNPQTLVLAKKCRGLGLGSNPINRSTGIISVFGDSPLFADGTDTSFSKIEHKSLLSEHIPDQHWDIVNVNDRTFCVGAGGLTKFFDGDVLSVAGPTKSFNGSFVVNAAVTADHNAGLDSKKWYAVYLVYFSELYGYYHILGPEVIFLPSGKDAISVTLVPDHNDPNVSGIYVYRSPGQTVRELAERVDPVAVSEGPLPVIPLIGDDAGFGSYLIDRPDDELFTTISLDRTITPIPKGLYATSHNNRLFIAGLDNKIYWSDPNAPHRFSSGVNFLSLVEKNSGPVTGIISALGSVYVFKLNSIWKVDAVGNTFRGIRISDTIGCVAPRSIVPLSLPTGQNGIFFWSSKGPHIVGGVTIQDISRNIEGSIDQETFDWLVPESVIAVNDTRTSQVVCLYKTTNFSDVYAEAVVFDYSVNAWVSFDGMLFTEGISATLTDSNTQQSSLGFGVQSLSEVSTSKTFWGGDNGFIYVSDYSQHKKDGLTSSEYALASIDDVGSGYVNVDAYANESSNIEGLWISFFRFTQGGDLAGWFTTKVIFRGVLGEIYYDSRLLNSDGILFSPAVGDKVVIGTPPAFVEFPWDLLDDPVVDKEVTRLTTWGRGLCFFTYETNWITGNEVWRRLFLEDKKRTNSQIKKTCESGKLSIVSLADDARLDAFNYMISRTSDGDRQRRA